MAQKVTKKRLKKRIGHRNLAILFSIIIGGSMSIFYAKQAVKNLELAYNLYGIAISFDEQLSVCKDFSNGKSRL